MANFVENVDFTVNDKSTIDRFHVELTFAFNVSDYLENDGFRITIRDLLTHKDLLITSDDLLYEDSYGLVPITDIEINEETKAKQINDSLIENEGLVIFLTGYNVLTIIMIPRCTKANKTIGFYSSNVFIQFTDDESVNSIKFYANLFPKMIRNETIVQNEEIDDPVLKDMNIRPAFDFNKNIDKNVERLFNYDTKQIFYANTTSKEHKEDEVPVYISTISAMGIDDVDKAIYDFNYDWEHAESYLIDESNGQKYDIDYTVENPDSYEFEPVPGFKTTVDDYLITQYIYKETPGFYKNKLVFNLENIPSDTVLESLRVSIEDLTPARFNSIDISGTANVKIYNPNVDYRTLDILTSGFMEDLFENIDAEIDYDGIDTSRYETYGEVTVPLKNICFDLPEGTKKAKGQFGFEAWLDIHDIERLTPEEIKDITRGWDSVAIDYYTEAPKLIPLSAEIVNWDPKYADNTIMLNEPETISVKITNLNLDYLDYPISADCLWNDIHKPYTNIDWSHYATDHYFTFDVTGLAATEDVKTYNFVVSGYIAGQDLDVEPPITEEQMKTETTGSTGMQFNLFNENLERLVFDVDSIVYEPELHIDDEGDLVKQIKKNSTQSFTIVLNNPNIKYRNSELYPVKVDIITGDDYFVGAEAALSYDGNYSEQSDLGGKMTVTVTNMHIDVPNVKKKIKLHAYINASDAHHTQEEIKTATETSYEDEDWWMMEDPVIPYEWDFMKDCVIYTNSILRTNNSYIGVKTIRCAGVNFEATNIQSDIYCCGDLIINNLNQNPNKDGYFPMDLHDYTSQSNPSLNFTNNGKLQYNYVHGTDKVPNLYYYYNPDTEYPERNSRFENRNNSVIGNDPWAGYIADGGMIMSNEDYVLKDIPELDVFPSTDTTKNIHVSQTTGTYTFTQNDPNYYDPEKKIFRAYNFSTENQTTVTFNPGEYHFKSWNRCETQLTIVIPEFGANDYVKIFVEDTIDISNSLKIINNNVNRLDEEGHLRCDSLLIYTRNGDIKFAASNTKQGYDKQIGILVAPNGTIELSNTCIWRGSTWAKNINVLADSEYHIV